MKISEIKKIVQDGKSKFAAFEKADEAIKELESLSQAEKDFSKRVESLKKESESLSEDVKKARKSAATAKSKAAFILETAEAEAGKVRDSAKDEAGKIVAKANEKLKSVNEKIKKQEAVLVDATNDAEKAKTDLAAINNELNAARSKVKSLLGE